MVARAKDMFGTYIGDVLAIVDRNRWDHQPSFYWRGETRAVAGQAEE